MTEPYDLPTSSRTIDNTKTDRNSVSSSESSSRNDSHPYHFPRGPALFFIMVSLFFSLLLVSFEQSVVSTALPVIANSFSALNDIEWVGIAYILPMTSFQPLFGKLSDVFGRKIILLVSILIFVTASAVCGAANNMTTLCAMRGVQGLGAAGIAPLVMITIGDIVPLRSRGKYQGIVALCWATGSAAGPLLGGILAEKVSWRWIFYINIPIGLFSIAVLVLFLDPNLPRATKLSNSNSSDEDYYSWKDKVKRIDFLGSLLFVSALACFLLATQWGGVRYPWSSPVIPALYAACCVLVAATVLVCWRISLDPILVLHLFKRRNNVALYVMNTFVCIAMFIDVYYLPIYFQVAHGDSPTMAGVQILPFLLLLDAVSILAGYIISKTGRYQFLFWIGTAFVAVGGGLQSILSLSTPLVEQVFILMITGIGNGMCIQSVYVAAQANANKENLASAISLVSFFGYFGFAAGIAIGGAIFNNTLAVYLQGIGLTKSEIKEAQRSPDFLHRISPELRVRVTRAYASSLKWVFTSVAVFGALAFAASLCMRPKRIPRHIVLEDDNNANEE